MVSNISFPEEGLSPLGWFPRRKKMFSLKGKFNLLFLTRQEIDAFFYFLSSFISLYVPGLTQSHCVLLLLFREEENHVLSWEL